MGIIVKAKKCRHCKKKLPRHAFLKFFCNNDCQTKFYLRKRVKEVEEEKRDAKPA